MIGRIVDRDERLRIRRLAQEKIGKHIRSAHISAWAKAAEGLDARRPLRPYHMDREVLRNVYQEMLDRWEVSDGYTDALARLRLALSDDATIENHAQHMERFAAEHSLWAVPPQKLIGVFFNQVEVSTSPG